MTRVPAVIAAALTFFSRAAFAEAPNRTVVEAPASPHGFDTPGSGVTLPATLPGGLAPVDAVERLDGAPGVLLQRTNRGAGAPILRGFIGIDTLIEVDGVRLNLGIWRTGPLQYPSLWDHFMFESIDLSLGPAGVRQGAGAVGGVVNLRTHGVGASPDGSRFGLHARLLGASADTSGAVHLRGRYGAGDVDGWTAVSARLAGDLRHGGGVAWPGDYGAIHWGSKNRLRLGDDWRIEVGVLGGLTLGAKRVDQLAQGRMRESDNLDQVAWIKAEWRDADASSTGGAHLFDSGRVTLSLRHMREDESQARCARTDDGAAVDPLACAARAPETVTRTEAWRDEVVALALDSVATSAFFDRRLSLDLLGGLRSEWVESATPGDPDGTPRFSPGSLYHGAHAGLWLDALVLGADAEASWKLRVDGGVRVESMRAFAPDVPGLGEVDTAFTGLGAGLRAVASWRETVAFHAGWTRGFRPPNLQEATILGDTGQTFELPNPSLGPQTVTGLEAGVRLRKAWRGGEFTLGAAVFSNRVADAIVRVPATFNGEPTLDGKEVVQRVNAESADWRGAEIDLRGRAGPVAFEVTASFLDGQQTIVDGEKDVVRRLPPANGRLALAISPEGSALSAGASLRWAAAQRKLAAGDRSDIRICADPAAPHRVTDACRGTDGWADVGLWVRWQALAHLAIGLRVDNLLDTRYRLHGSGLDAPGFNARLGLDLDL